MGIPKLKHIKYAQRLMEDLPMKKRVKDWHIWVGDKVEIVSGLRDIGKQGSVIKIDRGKNELMVSQCNMRTRAFKRPDISKKGETILIEAPLKYHQVLLVDPLVGKATTVTIQRKWDEELQRGKSVRISDKTSAEIPWPKPQNPFKDKPEGPMDTDTLTVSEVTFRPDITQNPFPTRLWNAIHKLRLKNQENSVF